MLLQPRKYLFKNRQKLRKKKSFKTAQLVYGDAGLQIHQVLTLSSTNIFRLTLLLKRSSRKGERTKRSFWFNAFPHLPLTRKVKNSRMGKGAGKLALWFLLIRPGTIIIEFRNLRPGRSNYFLKQLNHKLPVKVAAKTTSTRLLKYGHPSYIQSTFRPFFN